MKKSDCIFCKIVKKEIGSVILSENDANMAFLDISPFTTGHTIVIPKNHYYNFLDFDKNEMGDYFSFVQNLANKIKSRLNKDNR